MRCHDRLPRHPIATARHLPELLPFVAAAGVDGIAVGIQTLIKRLHESARLKSIDEKREKLKIRRVIDGSRLEVLHLPADVLEHFAAEKTGPFGPSTGAKNELSGSHNRDGSAPGEWGALASAFALWAHAGGVVPAAYDTARRRCLSSGRG